MTDDQIRDALWFELRGAGVSASNIKADTDRLLALVVDMIEHGSEPTSAARNAALAYMESLND